MTTRIFGLPGQSASVPVPAEGNNAVSSSTQVREKVDPALVESRAAAPGRKHVDAALRNMDANAADNKAVLRPAGPDNVDGKQPVHAVDGNGAQPLSEQEAADAAAIAKARELLDTVFRDLEKADNEEINRRNRLINNMLYCGLPDEAPQWLLSGLATAGGHLCALQNGRDMLAAMQAQSEKLGKARPQDRPAMLEEMQAQWQDLEMAEQELKLEEKTGTAAVRIFREDLAACKKIMIGMVRMAMEGLVPQVANDVVREGLTSAPVAEAIATLKLRTGAPLSSIAGPIVQGMVVAQAVLNRRDMELSLPAILNALSDDRSPQNVNAMVDYLFMDSYPGTMDTALLLKKALVPQTPQAMQGVELLHTLGAARRAIFQKLFADGSYNPETSASVHGFDLTFDQMRKLAGASGLRDMGYQVANLIALEVSACRSGLLDNVLLHLNKDKTEADLPALREQSAADVMRKAAQMEELGISRIVQSLTAVNADPESAGKIEEAMVEAARRFTMGLMGQTAEENVGKAVAKSARTMQKGMNAAVKDGFFYLGAGAKAANLLDSLMMRVTGIVDPEQRPISGDPQGIKRKTMDGAMRLALAPIVADTGELGRELLFGKTGLDLANLNAGLKTRLQKLGEKRSQVEDNAKALLGLITGEQRRMALKAKLQARRERSSSSSIAAMKSSLKALGKVSGREEAERLETARVVRHAFRLQNKINALTEELTKSTSADMARSMKELNDMHVQLDGFMRRLDGVDPATLLRTRPAGTHPSTQQLASMAGPARAVIYFAGDFKKKDVQQIAALEAEIKELNDKFKTGFNQACKFFGAQRVKQLNRSVTAAFMDMFIQSGADAKAFQPCSGEVLERVRARLEEWGLPAVGKNSFVEVLVQHAASRLALPDGSLDTDTVDSSCSLSVGIESGAVIRAASREALARQGHDGITKQTVRERDKIADQMGLDNEQARRAHGLGTTLASLGSGEGFVFNMSRGLELGIEAGPDISGIVSANIVAITPSVTLGALRENELAVHADGQGGFMVSMSAETTGSVNLGLEFSLGSFALNAPDEEKGEEDPVISLESKVGEVKIQAGYERGSASGVMLHFSSAEDCRAFLMDVMDPQSSLRRKDQDANRLWLTCDRMFTVQGGHVTKSFSMGATLGKLEAACLFAKTAVNGPSATFEATSTTRTSTEQNAHGYTEVMQTSGKVSFTVTKGINVGAELSLEPDLEGGLDFKGGGYEKGLSPFKEDEYSWEPASVTVTSRTERLYDGTIAGGSSISSAMTKGERGLEEVLAALGLDEAQRQHILSADFKTSAEVRDAFDAADADATVSVTWKLSDEGLMRLRGLESSMRLARRGGGVANGQTLAQMQKEYARLLNDRSLYEPAGFSVESEEEKSQSSLKVLAYSQSRTASHIGKVVVDLRPQTA